MRVAEIPDRLHQFGSNFFPSRPPKTFCQLVWEALDDLTMQILIVAALVSLVINLSQEEERNHLTIAVMEPLAIFAAVAACTLVAAVNDYQKEKQFIELNKAADDKKKVRLPSLTPRSPSEETARSSPCTTRSSSSETSSRSRRA